MTSSPEEVETSKKTDKTYNSADRSTLKHHKEKQLSETDIPQGILPFKRHVLYRKSHSIQPSAQKKITIPSLILYRKRELSPHQYDDDTLDMSAAHSCCLCWCCFFTTHQIMFKKRLNQIKNNIRNMRTLTVEEIQFITTLDKKNLIDVLLLYNECQEIITDYLVGGIGSEVEYQKCAAAIDI
jgi:hypothetical protein